MPWTPHDLPFIVEKARRGYDEQTQFWLDHRNAYTDAHELARLFDESAQHLSTAPLAWIDADFTDLVAAMARKVPEWTPAACMPSPTGMVAFHQPIMQAPYEHAHDDGITDVPVRVLSWHTKGNDVRVAAWAHISDIPSDLRSPLRMHLELEELMGITFPTNRLIDGGTDYLQTMGAIDREVFADATSDLQAIIGSLWLLMSQPRIVTDAPPVMATVRKRPKTGGKPTKQPVKVSVRTLVAPPAKTGGKRGQPTRQATSQWWVRGHWRQQPWGPNRAYRKPVYIAPHVAGNREAPLDERPHVQVWRTGG